VGGASGWHPAYVLVHRGAALVAATVAFIKEHSYGEYVFDWAWAGWAQRIGIDYYPKLVVAAPMTPATGPRILTAAGADRRTLVPMVAEAVQELATAAGCSSVHWLFCREAEQGELVGLGFEPRLGIQFHWRNRNYRSFDEFLAVLKSRKRKQVRKEREGARASIDELRWLSAPELSAHQLDALDGYYRATVRAHGGHDYLRPGFFHHLAETAGDTMQMVEVVKGGESIAAALFFETPAALYGRYWGARCFVEKLHFETAYYSGIERAIARGLPLFEAGAQGEHKLLRGFSPALTYSAHWIRDGRLRHAVARFLQREREAVVAQIAQYQELEPYSTTGSWHDDRHG
jgi:predicted N-acyltransferase